MGASSPSWFPCLTASACPYIEDSIQPTEPGLNERADFQVPKGAKHQLLAIVKRPEVNGVAGLLLLACRFLGIKPRGLFYRGWLEPQ